MGPACGVECVVRIFIKVISESSSQHHQIGGKVNFK